MKVFHCFVSRVRFLAALFALIGVTVPVSVIAQENNGEEYSSHAVASVWDLEVSSPGNSSLVGSFRVVNDSNSAISGVDYVVTLLSPRPEVQDGELISDTPIVYSREHVSANISLAPKEEEVIPFTHTIPLLPENELQYRVRVTLITSNNRLLDRIDQNIILTGSESMFAVLDPVSVLVDSVELSLEEDEEPIARSEWMPLEGVSVDPGTEVVLSSTLVNVGTETLSGTVIASFRRDLTTTTDFETRPLTAVTLSHNQEQTVDAPFVVPSASGVYEIFLTVEDEEGSRISTVGEFRVVVRGASASIVRVTADEIRLNKGEETVVTVSVVGPPDGSELSGTVEVALLDGETSIGSLKSGVELAPYVQSNVFRVLLDRAVEGDLTIRVTVRDGEGVILDTYELEFSRELATPSSVDQLVGDGQRIFLILVFALLVLIAIGFIAVYANRKLRSGSTILPLLLLLSLVVTAAGTAFVKYSEASVTVYEGVGTARAFPAMWWADRGLTHTVRTWYSIETDGQIQKVNPSSYVFTVGDRVIYEGQLISEMCTNYNQTYHNDWSIHLVGGHQARKRDASWSQQAVFGRRSFTTRVGYLVFVRGGEGGTDISGAFTLGEQHVNSAGQSTLFTDIGWNRPFPINRWWYYYLFTHLTVQEEQPPAPPSVTLTATPEDLRGGEPSTLAWTVENADNCYAFSYRSEHRSPGWKSGSWLSDWTTANVSAPPSGSKPVGFPVETGGMDYLLTLRCEGPGGYDVGSVVVEVLPPIPDPNLGLSSCSVSPNPADVNEPVAFNVRASGGNGTYQYAWSGDACAGNSGTFYSCGITDIYAEQVPGFVFHNIYIRVDNLPLDMDQYGITGAGTYDNRTFTVVSREPDGSAELKGDLTFNTNARNYFLSRKSEISLTDLSGNRVCVSLSETPEGAACEQSFSTEGPKTATVTVTSGTQTRAQTCEVSISDPNAPSVRFEVDGNEGGTFIKKKGDTSTLSWITRNLTGSDQCEASGAWTGIKSALGGSEFKSFNQVGSFIYRILCTRQHDGRTANAEVTIKVTEDGNGDSEDPRVTLKVDGVEARHVTNNTFSKVLGESSTIAWETHNLNTNDGDYCEGYGAQQPYTAWNSDKDLPQGNYQTDPPFNNIGPFTFKIRCYKQDDGGTWVEDYAIINITDNGDPLPPRPTNGYQERP